MDALKDGLTSECGGESRDIGEIQVMSSTVRTVDTARDLGVVIDSGLSMADQVSAICRAAYYTSSVSCVQ